GGDAIACLAAIAGGSAADDGYRQLDAPDGRAERQQADTGYLEGNGADCLTRPQPDLALSGASAARAEAVHGALTGSAHHPVIQRSSAAGRGHNAGSGRRCSRHLTRSTWVNVSSSESVGILS